MLKWIYSAFLTTLGAVIYRVRGGLTPALPRPFDQVLFSLAYGAAVYKASGRSWIAFLIVIAATTAALATGHGQYMDLGTYNASVEPESLDFLVQWIFGADNFAHYWRDAFGLAVTGIVVTIPCALGLVWYRQWLPAGIIGLSGVLKYPAYEISHSLGHGTVLGEYLTGAFLWGVVVLVWPLIKAKE